MGVVEIEMKTKHHDSRQGIGARFRLSGAAVLGMALLGFFLAPLASPAGKGAPKDEARTVLVLSDIHFNPLDDAALASRLAAKPASKWREILESSPRKQLAPSGADANYPLLKSALQAVRSASPNPEVVVIGGDFLVHQFESLFDQAVPGATHAAFEEFAARSIEFEARLIRDSFPRAQILPVLGNNDSPCGDYLSQPGSAFLRRFAEAWVPAVRPEDPARFVAEFSAAGYSSAPVRAIPGLRAFLLNGTYWSRKYENRCGPPGNDPSAPGTAQLAWLREQLAASRARGERVWLVDHIPPGVDGFTSLAGSATGCAAKPVEFYKDTFNTAVLSLLGDFHREIRLVLAAHTHMNDFRIYGANLVDAVPGLIVPSISPRDGNHPAFTLMSADSADAAIRDLEAYSLSASGWKREYGFDSAYSLPGVSSVSLRELAAMLRSPGTARSSFISFYDSGSASSDVSDKNWDAFWCAIENSDPASYHRCLCPGG